jgi:hypothetical protein
MSEILSKIAAHFDALGTRKIEVPEWGTEIYASPVTLAERTRIYAGAKGDNDYEVLAKIIITKAKDAEGKPLFTLADKATLLQRADAAVLIRLAAEIMNGPSATPDASELKNS